MQITRRAHRSNRLPPDPVCRCFGVKRITRNQDVLRAMLPGHLREMGKNAVPCLGGAGAHLFGQGAKTLAQMQIGRVKETEIGHGSTPEMESAEKMADLDGIKVSEPVTRLCLHHRIYPQARAAKTAVMPKPTTAISPRSTGRGRMRATGAPA